MRALVRLVAVSFACGLLAGPLLPQRALAAPRGTPVVRHVTAAVHRTAVVRHVAAAVHRTAVVRQMAVVRPPAPAPAGPAQYLAWIRQARQQYPYPESVDRMVRVMRCESGGNPYAVGSGRWYGLFQYVPGTWRGAWNPYRASSLFDAHAQIFATALAWHLGRQHEWTCYYLTWGH